MQPFDVSLVRARSVLRMHDFVGRLHRRGCRWLRRIYLPCLRRLETAASRRDRRLAARGWALVGKVHDLNGTPRAAERAFLRWLKLEPESAEPWRALASVHDALGEYHRARHTLLRALSVEPEHDGAAADLERIEWALSHGCPALYDDSIPLRRAAEHVAAGRSGRALELLARKRAAPYRRMRARAHGMRADVDGVLREWEAIAASSTRIQLQHADWFYAFQGEAADDPRLWRLLLWKVRPKLEAGGFHYSPSLAELEVGELKRFELHTRFELARVECDAAALRALAGSYPSWREPGEAALQLGFPG